MQHIQTPSSFPLVATFDLASSGAELTLKVAPEAEDTICAPEASQVDVDPTLVVAVAVEVEVLYVRVEAVGDPMRVVALLDVVVRCVGAMERGLDADVAEDEDTGRGVDILGLWGLSDEVEGG